MIKTILFISIMLLPTIIQAQVGILNALPEILENKERPDWHTTFAMSGKYRDDNSREKKLNLSLAGTTTYRANEWLIHTLAKCTYEWIDGEDQEANTTGHIRFRFLPYKVFNLHATTEKGKQHFLNKLHVEMFIQHEFDRFRSINTRALGGTGIVYISEAKYIDVAIGTSYMVEYIDFFDYYGREFNHRSSNYLQLEIDPTDRITIESITFVQFRIDKIRDILVMTSLGLKVKATDWFGIKLTFGVDYDSRPPPNIKNFGIGTGAEIVIEL